MERRQLLPVQRGKPVYARIASMAGIPPWSLTSGTPARLLVDQWVNRLGVYELPRRTWQMGRTPENGFQAITFDALISNVRERLIVTDNEGDLSIKIVEDLQTVLLINGLSGLSVANYHLDSVAQTRHLARDLDDDLQQSLWLWRRIYVEYLQRNTKVPQDFGDALHMLICLRERSQVSLSRELGVATGLIGNWARGDTVPASVALITRLETILEVPAGTLLDLALRSEKPRLEAFRQVDEAWWPEHWRRVPGRKSVPYYLRRRRVLRAIPYEAYAQGGDVLREAFTQALTAELEQGTHRGRMREVYEKPYGISVDEWPAGALEEWEQLRQYKCDDLNSQNKSRRGHWRPTSAEKQQEEVGYFFAWMRLPAEEPDEMLRGLGYSPQLFSLAWLAIPDVVINYLIFRASRSKQYNSFASNFLRFCRSLLARKRGWLWRSDYLLERLPEEQQRKIEDLGGWQVWCVYAHEELGDFLDSLQQEGKIVSSRDAFEVLDPLLKMDDPVKVIVRALERNRRDLDQAAARNRAISRPVASNWRNHILISFLIRLPLRAKHWCGLTYLPDNTGNLRRSSDGWELVLPYSDFKNSSNLAIFRQRRNGEELVLDFSAPGNELLQQLSPLLDLYVDVYWPVLGGGSESPYLFLKQKGGQQTSENLAGNVYRWTEEYLSEDSPRSSGIPGLKPFRTHSFRHIVATTLYRHHSARAAANALLVSELMIVMHYGRYLPAERLRDAFAALQSSFDIEDDDEVSDKL